jgi:hypothetical protein
LATQQYPEDDEYRYYAGELQNYVGNRSDTKPFIDTEVPKAISASRAVFDAEIAKGAPFNDALEASRKAGSYVTQSALYKIGKVEKPKPPGEADADAQADAAAVDKATKAYETGIDRGDDLYKEVRDNKTGSDPNARNVGREIVGYQKKRAEVGWDSQNDEPIWGMVDDKTKPIYGAFKGIQNKDVAAEGYDAVQLTPAERLKAALQRQTNVEATNTADLEATARGEGAGGAVAAARLKGALQRASNQASGRIAQLRGSEQRGARRQQQLAEGQQDLEAGIKIEELNQQDRQAAQAKVAELDTQRKQLQAQLDAARAKGDQDAVNDITKKQADLDEAIKKANQDATNTAAQFNTGEKNKVATDNQNRDVTVQDKNLTQEREGVTAGASQDVANADLRMRAQKALEDSAQGRLNEAQREEAIRQFSERLDLEKKGLDEAIRQHKSAEELQVRQQNIAAITSVITGLTAAAAKAAARGGLVKGPKVLVGEAGPEIVIPIKGRLSKRLEQALAIDAQPFKEPVPVQTLMSAIKRHLSKPEAPKKRGRGGALTEMLAAHNIRSRKAQ